MKIELISRIGKFCGVKIAAETLESDEAMKQAYLWAMTFGLFHKVGSKVYYAKTADAKAKVGKHSRTAAYSETLAKDVQAATQDVLKAMFSNISVETFAVIPADPWEVLRKQMKSLDFSDEQINKIIAEKQAAGEKPAPTKADEAKVEGEIELS
jgi:hypothetical protein